MSEQYTYDGSKIYDKEGEYLFQGFIELDGVLIAEKLNFQDQEIKNLKKENEQLRLKNELLEQDLYYCAHQFKEDVKNILLDLKGGLND